VCVAHSGVPVAVTEEALDRLGCWADDRETGSFLFGATLSSDLKALLEDYERLLKEHAYYELLAHDLREEAFRSGELAQERRYCCALVCPGCAGGLPLEFTGVGYRHPGDGFDSSHRCLASAIHAAGAVVPPSPYGSLKARLAAAESLLKRAGDALARLNVLAYKPGADKVADVLAEG
jgi:hypothetical protein